MSDIVVTDRLLKGFAVVIDGHEFVPEEVELSSDDGGKVIVESEDRARPKDGGVGEYLFNSLLSFVLGPEVNGGGVWVSAGSGEVNESVNSLLDAGMGDSLWKFDIDELKVLLLFDFVSGAEEIDDHIGVLHHSLNLILISVVHAVVHPATVFVDSCVRVGPQTFSSFRCSECRKLWSRLRGMIRLLPARPSNAAMGLPRVPESWRGYTRGSEDGGPDPRVKLVDMVIHGSITNS